MATCVPLPADVQSAFDKYPEAAQSGLLELRNLIFETATAESLGEIEESLKWGEPSYLASKGSAIRLAWKPSKPEKLGVYVNCQSKLVDTYRELYSDTFEFEDNRALLINLGNDIPKNEIKQCFLLALTYHTRKKLPLLGA